jgi:outer membrane protein TolC
MQSALRQRNISVLRLPSMAVEGQAQYQSDVATAPFSVGGRPLFSAPKGTVDTYFRAEQRLFDRTVTAQSAVEQAQLSEQQARVRTALFDIRQRVTEAFFAAAVLGAREQVVVATIADLQGRLDETNARVREGTALRADAAAIEATLLQRQQDADELRAARAAAVARLSTVVGRTLPADAAMRVPDLDTALATARQSPSTVRARPEFTQFQRTRERVLRQQDLTVANSSPRVSAYGRAGYGRPGLNFTRDTFDTYALGGVRVQWTGWNWGSTAREREALAIQARIVEADEESFARGLLESIQSDLATVDRLRRALTTDERIIDLRSEVARASQARAQEGVLTMAEYLSRDTELLQARLAQTTHRVELAQASARVLTTLGVEVR